MTDDSDLSRTDGADRPAPAAVCDGGDLDCGSGLLLIIRNAMQPIAAGAVLEVRSREGSVREDLPAWCRLVGHRMLGVTDHPNRYAHYAIRKKGADKELSTDFEKARDYEWRVRAKWTGGMQATAFVRNHSLDVGQPASFDTADPQPSAIEYLISALAADLAVGFQWRASRSGIEVFNLEVALGAKADNILVFLGVEDEGHPGLASIHGKVFIDSDGDDEEVEELWHQTLLRSPVAQTLVKGAPLRIEMRTS